MMELSDKQASFVREYVVDKNGKQAAIRAGYSPASAEMQASRLLSKEKVRAAVDEALQKVAEKTETEAEWVRKRLRAEAMEFGEGASHSARIRALELIGKINGIFIEDNKQKGEAAAAMLEVTFRKPEQPAGDG
jgi:phage terminase small subunit